MRARTSSNGGVDYIESPIDRIVGVQWLSIGPAQIGLSWHALLQGGAGYFPGNFVTQMIVDPSSGLPELSRTTLVIGLGTDDPSAFDDSVSGSGFPDGTTGEFTISGDYGLQQTPSTGNFYGGANYGTNAIADWFNKSPAVSIHLTVILPDIIDGTGFDWGVGLTANVGRDELSDQQSGVVVGGGTLNFTGTLILKPPSISLTAG